MPGKAYDAVLLNDLAKHLVGGRAGGAALAGEDFNHAFDFAGRSGRSEGGGQQSGQYKGIRMFEFPFVIDFKIAAAPLKRKSR